MNTETILLQRPDKIPLSVTKLINFQQWNLGDIGNYCP